MEHRRDGVVILARGASRRMGSPKGLLRCPAGPDRSFAEAIVSRYIELGLRGVLICRHDLCDRYRSVLGGADGFSVHGAEPGGETALTLRSGWRVLAPAVTHLWAHPVDLPLVAAGTLTDLRAVSRRHPACAVRPVWRQTPGHPVILPTRDLDRLATETEWRSCTMRELLAGTAPGKPTLQTIQTEVSDGGVCRDFDSPEDLTAGSTR